jgi:hypothetical protein
MLIFINLLASKIMNASKIIVGVMLVLSLGMASASSFNSPETKIVQGTLERLKNEEHPVEFFFSAGTCWGFLYTVSDLYNLTDFKKMYGDVEPTFYQADKVSGFLGKMKGSPEEAFKLLKNIGSEKVFIINDLPNQGQANEAKRQLTYIFEKCSEISKAFGLIH